MFGHIFDSEYPNITLILTTVIRLSLSNYYQYIILIFCPIARLIMQDIGIYYVHIVHSFLHTIMLLKE